MRDLLESPVDLAARLARQNPESLSEMQKNFLAALRPGGQPKDEEKQGKGCRRPPNGGFYVMVT